MPALQAKDARRVDVVGILCRARERNDIVIKVEAVAARRGNQASYCGAVRRDLGVERGILRIDMTRAPAILAFRTISVMLEEESADPAAYCSSR